MCVAIVIPHDVDPPSLADLKACERSNTDGAGVAWATGTGQVQWRKGIRATDVARILEQTSLTPGARLVHFRFATAGGADRQLCHPFPIDRAPSTRLKGRADRVLIHNGHWSDWERFRARKSEPGGPWSDTRLLARYYALGVPGPQLADASGRLAILSGDGSFETFGTWRNRVDDGCLWSNLYWEDEWAEQSYWGTSYKSNWYRYKSACESSYNTAKPSRDDDTLPIVQAVSEHDRDCEWCGQSLATTCQDETWLCEWCAHYMRGA